MGIVTSGEKARAEHREKLRQLILDEARGRVGVGGGDVWDAACVILNWEEKWLEDLRQELFTELALGDDHDWLKMPDPAYLTLVESPISPNWFRVEAHSPDPFCATHSTGVTLCSVDQGDRLDWQIKGREEAGTFRDPWEAFSAAVSLCVDPPD
jgi:hypothetical protein